MTGATAARAELPQMALPPAIRIARLPLSPANRPPTTPSPSVMAVVMTTAASKAKPSASRLRRSSEAPSRTMATSSTNWAVKTIPVLNILDGIQTVLNATPIRMARTMASIVA
jgi:hypothetical protein